MSITFNQALDNYYRLKENYDTQLNNNKKQILSNYKLSKREKTREYKKIVKKCVSCGQSGGTIFTTLFNEPDTEEEDSRILSAVCGHIANPCPLNIKLSTGRFLLRPNLIESEEKDIKEKKSEIISDKNKLLFGYISKKDALANFENIKEELQLMGMFLDTLIAEQLNVVDNKEKKEDIKKKQLASYSLIKQIQEAISNYDSSKNQQFIKDAVDLYIDNLKPLLDEIRNLKYKNVGIDYDENTNTYHLVEQKFTISEMEYIDVKPKIINYVAGNISIEAKKKATITPEPVSPEFELDSPKLSTPTPQGGPVFPEYKPDSAEGEPASPEYETNSY